MQSRRNPQLPEPMTRGGSSILTNRWLKLFPTVFTIQHNGQRDLAEVLTRQSSIPAADNSNRSHGRWFMSAT